MSVQESLPTESSGSTRITDLAGAIRDNVRPRDVIHLASHHSRPNAAQYELIRQFDGTSPAFTLASTGLLGPAALLVERGLVSKLVTSFVGENYPTPGPNRSVRRRVKDGTLAVESWSMLTLYLRFLGGMLGVPFMPTRSLLGSDTGRDLGELFKTVSDPFAPSERGPGEGFHPMTDGDSGRQVGLVPSLSPDISIVHALLADGQGNAVVCPPWAESPVGAFAAKRGVIVTADHIVPTSTIRAYSNLVKIPQSLVTAVVEVPFGGHPSGLLSPDSAKYRAYGDDYEFLSWLRSMSRDPGELNEWIDEWVVGGTHDTYLKRIGSRRLAELAGRGATHSWQWDHWADVNWEAEWSDGEVDEVTDSEVMAAVGSRVIAHRARVGGYRTMLSGAGAGNLAAWLAREQLGDLGYDIDLTFEGGTIGFVPTPADPLLTNLRSVPSATMLTDILYALGGVVAGATNRCIGVLSGAEVDILGNINSTAVGGASGFITGSGGANDIATAAQEIIITARQSHGRYKERVGHVTSPGTQVTRVVSEYGVFGRNGDDSHDLRLIGYIDRGDLSDERQYVERIRANCEWELGEVRDLARFAGPTPEELEFLRAADPRGYVVGPSDGRR